MKRPVFLSLAVIDHHHPFFSYKKSVCDQGSHHKRSHPLLSSLFSPPSSSLKREKDQTVLHSLQTYTHQDSHEVSTRRLPLDGCCHADRHLIACRCFAKKAEDCQEDRRSPAFTSKEVPVRRTLPSARSCAVSPAIPCHAMPSHVSNPVRHVLSRTRTRQSSLILLRE